LIAGIIMADSEDSGESFSLKKLLLNNILIYWRTPTRPEHRLYGTLEDNGNEIEKWDDW
jgi:hypothetical protein